MRIISKSKLRDFWERYPESKQSLENWYQVTRKANWESFVDVRDTFRHADVFQDCVIFDVGGNKFRLITKIRYQKKKVFMRFVLTHKEYDAETWKPDC